MLAFVSQRRVAVSEDGIRRFADRWPCSGLRGLRGVSFTFSQNGDLVDVAYRNGNSDRWDGEALVALSHDAQDYLGQRSEHTRGM